MAFFASAITYCWSMMERILVRSSTEPTPVTCPMRAYVRVSNSHSARQATAVLEMPPSPEARYTRIQQGKSAFPDNEIGLEESDTALTPSSSEGQEHTEANPERPASGRWRLGSPWTQAFASSAPNKPRHIFQDEYDQIMYDKVEDFNDGIPKLAAVMNNDEDFNLFRGYFPYATQILLCRMIEIGLLVEKLNKFDNNEANKPDEFRLSTVRLESESGTARNEMLKQLETKLGEYYGFLSKYAAVKALAQPSQRMQRSLHNWIIDHRPLTDGEDDFILHVNDLVAPMKKNEPGGQQGNQIETMIADHAAANAGKFIHRFITAEDEHCKSTGPGIHKYAPGRLATLRRVVVVTLSVGLLLTPVFLLFLVAMTRAAMVLTVFAFVVIFSIVLSLITEARTQDILIGTAAYGAFLVTFLGNMNQGFAPGAQ